MTGFCLADLGHTLGMSVLCRLMTALIPSYGLNDLTSVSTITAIDRPT